MDTLVMILILRTQCCEFFFGMILRNIFNHVSQYTVPIVSFLHFCVSSRTGEQLSQLRRQRHFYPSSLHGLGEFGRACGGHANSGCLENSGVPDNGQIPRITGRQYRKNRCQNSLKTTMLQTVLVSFLTKACESEFKPKS